MRSVANMMAMGIMLLSPAFAMEPVEGDFYTETIHLVDKTVNLVMDYGGNGEDSNDDSAALQKAIDNMTALPNGGKIIIPNGTFYLDDVRLKSNVHIEIDSGASLKSSATGTFNSGLFFFGAKSGIDSITPVQNASIRGSGGRFTVDFTDASNPNLLVVNCKTADNFLLADFNVLDNWTKFSAITVNTGDYNGKWSMSKNGVIKNISTRNQAYGYGLVQMKAGINILYKNLDGEGGATLRLESGGGVYKAPPTMVIDQVWARDISGTNGRSPLMMSPHTRTHGHVDIARVTSVSCGFSGTISRGFTTAQEAKEGYTPGTFAASCVVADVHATYGENAHYKSKHFKYVPRAIKHLISKTPNPDGVSYIGPSAANMLYDADTNHSTGASPGEYKVTFKNITHDGFQHQHKTIINKDDAVNAMPTNATKR